MSSLSDVDTQLAVSTGSQLDMESVAGSLVIKILDPQGPGPMQSAPQATVKTEVRFPPPRNHCHLLPSATQPAKYVVPGSRKRRCSNPTHRSGIEQGRRRETLSKTLPVRAQRCRHKATCITLRSSLDLDLRTPDLVGIPLPFDRQRRSKLTVCLRRTEALKHK